MKRKITTKNFTLFSLLIAGMSFVVSCGTETTTPEAINQEKEVVVKEKPVQKEKVTKIFYAIPSPVEMSSLIKSTNADYNPDLLNDVANAKNYTNNTSQAINLGTYFSDITYASMFEKTQESINYLSTIRGLADNLGIADAVGKDIYKRLDSNKDNRDSLLTIFSETYWTLNGYLKEENREEISAMIIGGGWIEGLYLAVKHYDGNDAIRERIGEQKYTLKNLVSLMDSHNSPKLDGMKQDLKELTAIYDEVELSKGNTEKSTSDGVVELSSNRKLTISEETITKIKDKVSAIRTKYIQ